MVFEGLLERLGLRGDNYEVIGETHGLAVVVTGCDIVGGFGHSIVCELVKKGFTVFACCLTEKGAENWGNESSRVVPVIVDVTKDVSVRKCVQQIEEDCAWRKIQVWGLVNNAGVHDGGLVDWTSMDQFEKVMSVNFFGLVRMTKAFLPLIKQSKGRVVNLTSMDGLRPLPGIAAYTSSKHAADSFSRTLAYEMSLFGVKVITVNPGTFQTAMSASGADNVRRTWAKTDQLTRTEYGPDYAEKLVKNVDKAMKTVSKDVSKVGKAVTHAISSIRPSRRYVVGYDAQFFWKPLRDFLPESLFDWIVELVLRFGIPRPASMITVSK